LYRFFKNSVFASNSVAKYCQIDHTTLRSRYDRNKVIFAKPRHSDTSQNLNPITSFWRKPESIYQKILNQVQDDALFANSRHSDASQNPYPITSFWRKPESIYQKILTQVQDDALFANPRHSDVNQNLFEKRS